MLLHEIVGGQRIRQSSTIETPDPYTRPSRDKKKDALFIGQGAQGMALARPKKINVITKIFGFDSENDPYLKFIQALVNTDTSNPYMPRVEKLRVFNKPFISNHAGEEYNNSAAVDIERLLHLTNPKVREAAKHQLQRLGVRSFSSLDASDMWKQYQAGVGSGTIDSDPQFEEAVRFIRRVTDELGLDLHSRNIMVRMTSTGPQLVLVDPVFNPHR